MVPQDHFYADGVPYSLVRRGVVLCCFAVGEVGRIYSAVDEEGIRLVPFVSTRGLEKELNFKLSFFSFAMTYEFH